MPVSKATVLTLWRFNGLQDNAKNDKFVAKEAGFSPIISADQAKLDGIASIAQINIIESISIDGVAQTVTNKGVELDLPKSNRKIDLYNVRTTGGNLFLACLFLKNDFCKQRTKYRPKLTFRRIGAGGERNLQLVTSDEKNFLRGDGSWSGEFILPTVASSIDGGSWLDASAIAPILKLH